MARLNKISVKQREIDITPLLNVIRITAWKSGTQVSGNYKFNW